MAKRNPSKPNLFDRRQLLATAAAVPLAGVVPTERNATLKQMQPTQNLGSRQSGNDNEQALRTMLVLVSPMRMQYSDVTAVIVRQKSSRFCMFRLSTASPPDLEHVNDKTEDSSSCYVCA